MIYEETKGDIEPFLRLYRLSKRKGMGIKQVVNILTMLIMIYQNLKSDLKD